MWNVALVAASVLTRSRRFSTAILDPCIVHKRGTDILHDSWFNKVDLNSGNEVDYAVKINLILKTTNWQLHHDVEIQNGILYPSINSIRHITAVVGAAVLRAAIAEDLAQGHGEVGPRELQHMSKEETMEYVTRSMWFPVHRPLVHEK